VNEVCYEYETFVNCWYEYGYMRVWVLVFNIQLAESFVHRVCLLCFGSSIRFSIF
jgi:hypothetical protein